MAKYNIYAIAYGKDPKTKEPVYNLKFPTWDECKSYIVGVEGARYKGFLTEEEANVWLEKVAVTISKIKDREDIPVKDTKEDNNLNSLEFSVSMSKEFRDFCIQYSISPRELTEYLMNNFVQEQKFLKSNSMSLPWN